MVPSIISTTSIEEDLGNETNEVESDNVENNVVLCSQCSQPFASEAQCSQHMALAHNPHQPKTLVNSHETHHQTTAKRKRTKKPNIMLNDFVVQPVTKKISKIDGIDRQGEDHEECQVSGCGLAFPKETLPFHTRCHVGMEFRCFACPSLKNFKSWSKCSYHLWTAHRIDTEDLLACPHCSEFKTNTRHKLEIHMEVHSEVRKYACSACSKRFKQLAQLRNHSVVHMTGEQRAGGSSAPPLWYTKKRCEICDKFFSDSKCLKKHIQAVHSKLKPYICHVCNHQSARKSMLELHMRQHTGEKPYSCDICNNYRTGDHNSLRRHKLRLHAEAGNRPYQCLICGYSTVQSDSFKKHVENNHSDQPSTATGVHSCPKCLYKTVNENSYQCHLRLHEREQEKDIEIVIVTSQHSDTAVEKTLSAPDLSQSQEEEVAASKAITNATALNTSVSKSDETKEVTIDCVERKGDERCLKDKVGVDSKLKKSVKKKSVKKTRKEIVKPQEDEDSLFPEPMDHGGTTIPAE